MAKEKGTNKRRENKTTGLPNWSSRKQLDDANLPGYSKLPPQAVPLEEVILSAILIDRDAMTKVLDTLTAESFYKDAHKAIYRSMRRLFERSQPIDLLMVMEDLKKNGDLEIVGGPAYLAELSSKVTSSANVEYHARIVTEKFIQRELIRTSTEIITEAYEDSTDVLDLLDKAGNNVFEITERNMGKQVADMGTLANQMMASLEELRHKEDGLTGVPSGFTELDRLTSGLQPSDLIILAARPAMGKTSFVLSIARNAAADYGKGVAFFSLEMSAAQLAGRIFAQDAEVNGQKMRSGKFDDDEWARLVAAMNHLGEAPIYIDDTAGINVFELRAKCRRLKMEKGISMVIIDYLQLMSGTGEGNKGMNREQEVSGISRALKGLAKELEVPVIALSQLSRAVETRGGDKRPQLSDLRESGCLTGDTRVTMADTGERKLIKDLVSEYPNGGFKVWSVGEDYKLKKAVVSCAFSTGIKTTYELQTALGRKIKATANHKFLTFTGWKRLDELTIGDHLALPRVIKLDGKSVKYSRGVDDLTPALSGGEGDVTLTSLVEHKVVSKTQSISVDLKLVQLSGEKKVMEMPQQTADIYWDQLTSITKAQTEEVFDLTVPGPHNFVANDIIVHNSIEQDADMVMFLYRPEYYKIMEDEQGNSLKGITEIIVGKNRHGEARDIKLRFESDFAKFSDLDDPDFDLLPSNTFESAANDQPYTGTIMPSKMNEDEDIPF